MNGAIEPFSCSFMAGPITTAVDDVEGFIGIGQRNHERMVTPLAFVIDVDSFFAFPGGFHHRSIAFDESFLKKTRRLLPPNFHADGIEDLHQQQDRQEVESTTEIPGSRGVGDSFGSERVEIRFVISSEFKVFQASAAGENVVRDIQHVIRLGIRQVDLEYVDVLIDGLVEFEDFRHALNQPNPTSRDSLVSICDLVLDVRGGDHRAIATEICFI
jgi:hypothetical protein